MLYGHNSEKKLIGNTLEERERYLYLIQKFFGGKTLWDRTELECEGGLIERCMGECSSDLHGKPFCLASFRVDVECPYAGNRVKGGNPYHTCTYFSILAQNMNSGGINPENFRNLRRM